MTVAQPETMFRISRIRVLPKEELLMTKERLAALESIRSVYSQRAIDDAIKKFLSYNPST
jgi:hypothetical protein